MPAFCWAYVAYNPSWFYGICHIYVGFFYHTSNPKFVVNKVSRLSA